jgi:hypothetical protein
MRVKIESFQNLSFNLERRDRLGTKKRLEGGPLFASAEIQPVRLGLVALSKEVDLVRDWFRRMEGLILSSETNVRRFREFPGTRQVFKCRYELTDQFLRCIDVDTYRQCEALPIHERFEKLLDLFASRVESLFGDVRPDCVLVCLPEELAEVRISNPKLSFQERAVLERLQKEDDD